VHNAQLSASYDFAARVVTHDVRLVEGGALAGKDPGFDTLTLRMLRGATPDPVSIWSIRLWGGVAERGVQHQV
jgi:hypothetical protein